MARTTIDFGIDLGTTNSLIACMQGGNAVVLKNNDNEDRTPSVVRLDANGNATVGRRAYARLEDDPENTQAEFKRLMGTRETKTFQRSGRSMTPEELSAEVLKSLRADAQNALGEDVKAAVITVPAMFELPQCEATQRAANLAGIEHAPLLQEPIAAALAYGHEIGQPNGYWMVYDLGGGTFDISVVTVREGRLAVVDHSGDNFLGGKDFDWLLVDFIIDRLNQQFSLGDMTRGSRLYLRAIAKLKVLAEDAKIQLTQQEKVSFIVEELCEDQDGRPVEATIEVTRRGYESLIRQKVDKTIQLCRAALDSNHLLPADIERIVLVGAPTKTPYVRRRIQEELGIEVEIRVDPITVVAEGAAVFSSSQRLEQPAARATAGQLSVKLSHSDVTQDTEHLVTGRISPAIAGMSVELVRDDGGWRSGRIAVARDGFFEAWVNLRERRVNQFSLLIYDTGDSRVDALPDSFTVRHGLTAAPQPLSRSVGVVVIGDEEPEVEWLVEHGTPLPTPDITRSYRTVRPVVKGISAATTVLDIHIVHGSGESTRPASNRPIGKMQIRGDQIPESLRADSEVLITFKVDASMILQVTAFVPELDFPVPRAEMYVPEPNPDVQLMKADFTAQQERFDSLKLVAESSTEPDAELALRQLQRDEHQRAFEEIEDLLKSADEDRDAAQNAQRKLQDLKASLDPIEDQLSWTRLHGKYFDDLMLAQDWVERYGNEEDKEQLQRLADEAEDALKQNDPTLLRERTSALRTYASRTRYGSREFWIDLFKYLGEEKPRLTDPERAEELIATGWTAIRANDDDLLQAVTWELWDHLPREEQRKSPYANVGIRRA